MMRLRFAFLLPPRTRSCSSVIHQKWIQPTGHDTGIKVFNCVAESKVPLIVRNRNLVTFYTCGPTVYDVTHLGHASCYVKLDIVQRLLRDYFQLNLLTAMNVTDIDDKIIRRGEETGRSWKEIAQENEQEFWASLKSLGVQSPDYKLRVTEHLAEIQSFIQRLTEQGHAYLAKDNSTYFSCTSLPGHGKLTKQPPPDPNVESIIKKCSSDFVLWKSTNYGPAFESQELGPGRPGWHIECSTMASKVFGPNIDFHGGGWDLKFPHHENEESQSCAFHKTDQWVNYWLHTGQLRLQGATEKMSKSLKNTISVGDFLKTHSADDFRMFCVLSNYRSNTEYSDEAVFTANRVLKKLQTFIGDLELHLSGQQKLNARDNCQLHERISSTIQSFDAALKDDFDTARAMKSLIELIGYVNKEQHESNSAEMDPGLLSFTERFYKTQLKNMGFGFLETAKGTDDALDSSSNISPVIETVLAIRNELRRRGKSSNDKSLFSLADHIRKQLSEAGIEIKDRDTQKTTWSWKD